jgi:hypothetical protein
VERHGVVDVDRPRIPRAQLRIPRSLRSNIQPVNCVHATFVVAVCRGHGVVDRNMVSELESATYP